MKTKKISKEEYIKTFCRDQRIRSRQVIYVSSKVHNKLRDLTFALRKTHTSTASLVDTILIHHLETHKDAIAEIEHQNESPKMTPKVPSKVSSQIPDDELDYIFSSDFKTENH